MNQVGENSESIEWLIEDLLKVSRCRMIWLFPHPLPQEGLKVGNFGSSGCIQEWLRYKVSPESIEWFIEDQGFSPWLYDLAPPPSPPPLLSPVSKLYRRHTGSLRMIDNLLTGERGGARSHDREKAWSSLNHSILSGENLFWSHLQSNE